MLHNAQKQLNPHGCLLKTVRSKDKNLIVKTGKDNE